MKTKRTKSRQQMLDMLWGFIDQNYGTEVKSLKFLTLTMARDAADLCDKGKKAIDAMREAGL